jgi:hypothetical protein
MGLGIIGRNGMERPNKFTSEIHLKGRLSLGANQLLGFGKNR